MTTPGPSSRPSPATNCGRFRDLNSDPNLILGLCNLSVTPHVRDLYAEVEAYFLDPYQPENSIDFWQVS